MTHTKTTRYQNSVLHKSLRVIRNGYVNKYTHPRQIGTTTAAYHAEIGANFHKQRPRTKLPPTQFPLCVFKAKNAKGMNIHKGRLDPVRITTSHSIPIFLYQRFTATLINSFNLISIFFFNFITIFNYH